MAMSKHTSDFTRTFSIQSNKANGIRRAALRAEMRVPAVSTEAEEQILSTAGE